MDTFLKQVAKDLYHKLNGDFAHVAVVFPNKRASLFFSEYLTEEADRPIWSPAYISISDLFRQHAEWQIADPIKLVCELYKVYQEVTKSKETLDDFYFWGEMLISDFDDADKNLVKTDALFQNLKDLNKLMDDYDFLEEGQKEALSQFFHNFSINHLTELKQRFISIWDVLGEIYTRYKSRLAASGLAYEGMLYREVIEQLEAEKLPYRTYVFVGFNVLNRVEHRLFSRLTEAGKARFYWDYDQFYLDKHPHEAGEFIRRNLRDFPSELPASNFNNLVHPKEVTYVASPTENGQTRYLPQWIRENLTPIEKETAVVLCNENLLQPVLHSLPENIRHTNITMGFPLSQTPAYSFINALTDLHTDGYQTATGRFKFDQVMSVLKHPYTRLLSQEADALQDSLKEDNRFFPLPSELKKDAFLEQIFTPCESNETLCRMISETLKQVAICYRGQRASDDAAFDQLYRESLFKAYTLLNRFYTLMEEKELAVQRDTFKRLLKRVMGASSIPFHGEPAIGMQVMGVLETRNLDFRHLILLSVNEGQLPKTGGDSSFIPYNLRKAFGMTTIDHKMAVYAYYFYRLMQRAEKVTLMYNTSTEGMNRGELSRFMLQFLIEWGHPIERKQLEAGQDPQGGLSVRIEKSAEVYSRMRKLFDRRENPKAFLSPTALNTYLDCRLKFYYKYIAQLRTPEEVTAEIDNAKFGTIFHDAAENIYKDLQNRNQVIGREAISQLLKEEVRIKAYVDNAFKRLFFHIPPEERPQYNGLQLINAEVITRYVRQLLGIDLTYTPFTFVGSEKRVYEDFEVQTPDGKVLTRIGGSIDRLDEKDGVLRIIDYKTGGRKEVTDLPSLFIPGEKRPGHVFQTLLYAAVVCQKLREQGRTQPVAPALLYIHRAASESYSPIIELKVEGKNVEVTDFALYESDFRQELTALLEEIFCPEVPFTQTDIEDRCSLCDFKALCQR